jgi:hypothetical protein
MMRQRTCVGGESRGKKSEVEGYGHLLAKLTGCRRLIVSLSNVPTLMEES